MDQTIASYTATAPRNFLRGWALSVLLPGLACGGFAVAVASREVRPDDWIFIFTLGTPLLFWFVVGLLQGRLLRRLIERPKVWAVATWGGGSLAMVGGFAMFGWLTFWIDEVSHVGFDPEHPIALALFGVSGMAAGLIIGFLQAVTMHATWAERRYWLLWSTTGGCLAFAVLWVGVNAIAVMGENRAIDFPKTGFFVTIAGSLLAGALAHNLLTGIALQLMLAKRAKRRENALIGQFD
jgi:hypothetical protein